MCGCWSRAATSISRRNRSAPIDAASSGRRTLTRHLALVLQVLGEVHGGHAALPELALEAVAVLQGVGQGWVDGGHGCREIYSRLPVRGWSHSVISSGARNRPG